MLPVWPCPPIIRRTWPRLSASRVAEIVRWNAQHPAYVARWLAVTGALACGDGIPPAPPVGPAMRTEGWRWPALGTTPQPGGRRIAAGSDDGAELPRLDGLAAGLLLSGYGPDTGLAGFSLGQRYSGFAGVDGAGYIGGFPHGGHSVPVVTDAPPRLFMWESGGPTALAPFGGVEIGRPDSPLLPGVVAGTSAPGNPSGDIPATEVPEPATLALLGGLYAFLGAIRILRRPK